ncbi:MAG: iron-containing alcohol dehydrogenase [Armatimonadota bacterium]
MSVKRTIVSPWRFVVGPDILPEIGLHARWLGERGLLLGGQRALAAVREPIEASLRASELSCHVEQGAHVDKVKRCVDELVRVGREQGVDFAIACGGRVMDCGKAVARELGVPLIVVPTTAGTNAAGTISSGIEGDDVPRRHWYRGPDVVFCDTRVIVGAGPRYLASGMGDVLSFGAGLELALQMRRPGNAESGALGLRDAFPTAAAEAIARLTFRLVLDHGKRAYDDAALGIASDEVGKVCEAIFYCSAVGGAACGVVGGDHTLHLAHHPRCTRQLIHGEWVAFGALVNLILFGCSLPRIAELIAFNRSVNLPTCFADFGIAQISREELVEHARTMVGADGTASFGLNRAVTATEIAEAMLEVDHLARTL